MTVKCRAGSENWFYRFSYKRQSYCEGGFRTMGQASEAERLRRDALINRDLHPEISPLGKLERWQVQKVCDVFLEKHGPSLKGYPAKKSTYYNVKTRLGRIKRAWNGKIFDEVNKFDVRDFLASYRAVGTKMRYLDTMGTLFRKIDEYNKEGLIVPGILCPTLNPAQKWRSEMKSSHKKEKPRVRVLSQEEWSQFKSHLTARSRAICEIALRRFLRLGDIKRITYLKIKGQTIQGIQEKTGEPFMVPVLDDQPVSYDFTNFIKEFKRAQVSASLDYPKEHPLHFSPRDLRRTGATWAYHRTKDLRSIQRLLGHTSLSMTERYLNVTYENVAGIAAVVDEMANLSCNRIATEIHDSSNGDYKTD